MGFRDHAESFLLEDLVSEVRDEVRFFRPFADFTSAAIPKDLDT